MIIDSSLQDARPSCITPVVRRTYVRHVISEEAEPCCGPDHNNLYPAEIPASSEGARGEQRSGAWFTVDYGTSRTA